jgi:hypothetical protein
MIDLLRQPLIGNTAFLSCLSQGHPFAFVQHPTCRALIVLLSIARNPCTIVLTVWPIIIASLNAIGRSWSWTHISEKLFKRCPQEADATPTIMGISCVSRQQTPSLHGTPNIVFRGTTLAMRCRSRLIHFLTQTPTALRPPLAQFFCSNQRDAATVTLTRPLHCTMYRIWTTTQYDQPPKTQPLQVFQLPRTGQRFFQTSATFCLTSPQHFPSYKHRLSTVTDTMPLWPMIVGIRSTRQHAQATKLFPGQILQLSNADLFTVETPAAARLTRYQAIRRDKTCRSAETLTRPCGFSRGRAWSTMQDSQTPEDLSGEITKRCHTTPYQVSEMIPGSQWDRPLRRGVRETHPAGEI